MKTQYRRAFIAFFGLSVIAVTLLVKFGFLQDYNSDSSITVRPLTFDDQTIVVAVHSEKLLRLPAQAKDPFRFAILSIENHFQGQDEVTMKFETELGELAHQKFSFSKDRYQELSPMHGIHCTHSDTSVALHLYDYQNNGEESSLSETYAYNFSSLKEILGNTELRHSFQNSQLKNSLVNLQFPFSAQEIVCMGLQLSIALQEYLPEEMVLLTEEGCSDESCRVLASDAQYVYQDQEKIYLNFDLSKVVNSSNKAQSLNVLVKRYEQFAAKITLVKKQDKT